MKITTEDRAVIEQRIALTSEAEETYNKAIGIIDEQIKEWRNKKNRIKRQVKKVIKHRNLLISQFLIAQRKTR